MRGLLSSCFGEENAPLNLSVNTAKRAAIYPPNHQHFVNTGDSKVTHASNSDHASVSFHMVELSFCRETLWTSSHVHRAHLTDLEETEQKVITAGWSCICMWPAGDAQNHHHSARWRFLHGTSSWALFHKAARPSRDPLQIRYLEFPFLRLI